LTDEISCMSAHNQQTNDHQAIARLKRGDPGGLEALVCKYQVQAMHAAYLVVRDRPLAEDVVQSAFLRAAEKIEQFDEQRPFGPWFLRSVLNAALKAAKRQQRLVSLEADPGDTGFSLAEWLADPAPRPEALVETQETRQAVWQALGQLSPEQRAAIVLRHFLEFNEAEMTKAMQRPPSTIKWRLHTARQRLRKLLRPWGPPVDPEEDGT
jgi:RNA polymerase sigma-70 factor (ECF subfamily)